MTFRGAQENDTKKAGKARKACPTAMTKADVGRVSAGDIRVQNDLSPSIYVEAGFARLTGGFSPLSAGEAFVDWAAHSVTSPQKMKALADFYSEEWKSLLGLYLGSISGAGKCRPCEKSLPQDKRFVHETWTSWPFSLMAESFLSVERFWDEATKEVDGATPHHLDLVNFIGRQALEAVAPSNFFFTNPEVLEETVRSSGANLISGTEHFLTDLKHILSRAEPRLDAEYLPGESVAITEGFVIYRNDLVEVIQYTPTTTHVRPEPVVIVPAWIMKYYVLDLRPKNSLVKYLVDQGFTVFMISWRNPDPSQRNLRLDDYRSKGVMPALDAALSITGAKKAHSVGYCIGGTLLATVASAMARDDDHRLKSTTLFAAQVDFSEAGELRVFIDEPQLAALEAMTSVDGFFEASQMAGTFNLLRSNDLIWSRMVRRYFMGSKEIGSDVSAWSKDSTRLPQNMYSEYLRSLYLRNDLAEGRFVVGGMEIRLDAIQTPMFVVGTEWDHVAPWMSVYKVNYLTDTECTFCLTNGGHNQGIISPPERVDRHYRIATRPREDAAIDPDSWFKANEVVEGSWWPAWSAWLGAYSGIVVLPPTIGRSEDGYEILCKAPGTYVME